VSPITKGSFYTGFWRAIGRGLEKLIVTESIDTPAEIGAIQQHCRNLNSISLAWQGSKFQPAIAALLASYGDQLKYSLLWDIDEQQLREIADACPTARFHLEGYSYGCLLAGLNVLGPRLENVTSSDFEQDIGGIEFANPWYKCCNLRELHVKLLTVETAEAIFSTPKEHLKLLEFCLDDKCNVEYVKNVMNACSKGTRCVEKLIFDGPLIILDCFNMFFKANMASLSSVTIRNEFETGFENWGFEDWSFEEDWDAFLDLFLTLPALEEAYLACVLPAEMKKNSGEARGLLLVPGVLLITS